MIFLFFEVSSKRVELKNDAKKFTFSVFDDFLFLFREKILEFCFLSFEKERLDFCCLEIRARSKNGVYRSTYVILSFCHSDFRFVSNIRHLSPITRNRTACLQRKMFFRFKVNKTMFRFRLKNLDVRTSDIGRLKNLFGFDEIGNVTFFIDSANEQSEHKIDFEFFSFFVAISSNLVPARAVLRREIIP